SSSEGWEEAFERQRRQRWDAKVEEDLRGWRGGNGTARSSYSKTAVPTNSYYGQSASGVIGTHLPKEIVRIERDWSDGEVCQFETSFPMELEGRVQPKKWAEFVSTLNRRLLSAYSIRGAVIDNLFAIATWWTSLLWRTSHFEKELRRAELYISDANRDIFNPVGLNVLSPRHLALQFVSPTQEVQYSS
ncbi:Golgin subfamily A member 7/ERF4 family-domain-containing protein, partial [Kockovaella imperatae]